MLAQRFVGLLQEADGGVVDLKQVSGLIPVTHSGPITGDVSPCLDND